MASEWKGIFKKRTINERTNPAEHVGGSRVSGTLRHGAGTQDAHVDCEKWEKLCAELLQERASLQAELEKTRAEGALRSSFRKCPGLR